MKKQEENKIQKTIKKYLTWRFLLIGIIFILLLFLLSDFVKGILLLVIFFPMSLYTARITKFVNGVTLETATASTILIAYLYGPSLGALAGLVITAWSYLANSIAKLRAYLDIIYTTFCGFFAGYMTRFDFNFGTAFVIAIIVKNVVAFFFNHFFFDPDKISNIVYRITHLILNVFIYRLFFELIYAAYNLI
ncbi:hypothetical protein JW930_06650 [Candidatus Woesearchaeota archaeon]|nr:hypothetical protein [Candidatus Woesearchaeota archaeon]